MKHFTRRIVYYPRGINTNVFRMFLMFVFATDSEWYSYIIMHSLSDAIKFVGLNDNFIQQSPKQKNRNKSAMFSSWVALTAYVNACCKDVFHTFNNYLKIRNRALYAFLDVLLNILAKSSNRPLTFYRFSSNPQTIVQFYLHPQIGRCASQLRHQKVDKTLNITSRMCRWTQVPPFLKFTKFSIIVTICEKTLFEIANFHEQYHFTTKVKEWRNGFMQKWTLFLYDNCCYGTKC